MIYRLFRLKTGFKQLYFYKCITERLNLIAMIFKGDLYGFLVISHQMTYKTGQMCVPASVRPSARPFSVNIFKTPRFRDCWPRSMKHSVYIIGLTVWGQFLESEF